MHAPCADSETWTDSFGDIYLGSTEDDSIYIPGIIKGMFTVEGTVLAPATGTARPHPGQSWTVDSMPDRTGLRIDLQEALRFNAHGWPHAQTTPEEWITYLTYWTLLRDQMVFGASRAQRGEVDRAVSGFKGGL